MVNFDVGAIKRLFRASERFVAVCIIFLGFLLAGTEVLFLAFVEFLASRIGERADGISISLFNFEIWFSIPGLISCFVIFFICKTGFYIFIKWFIFSFYERLVASITRDLLNGLFLSGYEYLAIRNANEIFRNLFSEVATLVGVLVKAPANFLVELVLMLALVGYLIKSHSVIVVIGLCVLVVSLLAWFKFVSSRIKLLGRRRIDLDAERVMVFQDSLQGFVDIHTLGVQGFVVSHAGDVGLRSADVAAEFQVAQLLPRAVIETVLVAIFAALPLIGFVFYDDVAHFLADEAFFVVAGFAALRLLPGVTAMAASIQSFIFGLPSATSVLAEFRALGIDRSRDKTWLNFPYRENFDRSLEINATESDDLFIELKELAFGYESQADLVLNGVTLKLRSGLTYGLQGESGCGKSTLVKILVGLLTPTSGKVCLGCSGEAGLKISYVPQRVFIFNRSLRENISLGRLEQFSESVGNDLFYQCISNACLDGVVDSFADRSIENLGDAGLRLSGGQQQRVGIARAVLLPLDILILDEAFANLDSAVSCQILYNLRETYPNAMFLVVSHDVKILDQCDVVLRMEKGKIF